MEPLPVSRSSAGGHALEETAAIADAYTVNSRQRLRNLRCHGPRPFSGSLCSGGHRLSQLGVGRCFSRTGVGYEHSR